MPLISIALCTYNGERHLSQQLDSLLRQTYPRYEIVVFDDSSSDATRAILERYAQADPRLRLSVNAENLGFKRNFERALAQCRGELIAPCDQDDIWLPQKLARLAEALGDAQLAYCDSTLASEAAEANGPRMSAIVPMLTTDDPVPFAFGNCVSGHAMLFRRELLARALPVPDEFFHDWWLAAVAAARGGIVFHPESLVLYRQHGANVTDARLAEMMEAAGLQSKRREASRRERNGGDALRYVRETERRLAAIAALAGPHQSFAVELHRLWRRHERQWLSPRLALLMSRHRARLLRFASLSDKKARRYCRSLWRGMRLKALQKRLREWTRLRRARG